MKILVIDDEKAVKALFQQWFEEELEKGLLDFDFVFSAEDALDYINEKTETKLILILSDINMPGMNGLELLKILKQKYQAIPVVMITAYGDDYNMTTAKRYGADGFINKPIDFLALQETFDKYLK